MFESTLNKVTTWMSHRGSRWRVSTWWPSDSRTSMQRSLLRVLSVAQQEQLDVEPLVTNLAEEHRGSYRRRLRQLARRLRDGTPLVDALEQTPDTLRDETVLALRFAHQTGTLAPTYHQLLESPDPGSSRFTINLRQAIIYSLITLLLIVLAIGFLTTFIWPTLEVINEEFTAQTSASRIPWAMATLSWLWRCVTDHAPLWILGIVVLAFLVWSAPSRRYFRRALATRWVRGIAQIRSAELLQMLSLAVEQGRPMPAALSTLARYHFDSNVRQKLMFSRIEAEHRDDVWKILSDARLISPEESEALAQSTSDRTRAWAMRRLARWKRDRARWRADTIIKWLWPIMLLVFASIVLLAGSAMIGFLSHMIQELA